MTTTILKSKITKAIAGINDKSLLEALYTIINRADKAELSDFELSDKDMQIIEGRRKAYKSGNAKTITMSEMRKRFTKKFPS